MNKFIIRLSNPQEFEGNELEVFLASPNLVKSVLKASKITPKLKRSLLKYENRSKYRATPFGGFSTCSVVNWDEQIKFETLPELILSLNFNTFLIQELVNNVKQKNIKQLSFYKNPSLYEISNEYRYVENYVENNRVLQKISSVDKTEESEKILLYCEGTRSYNELLTFIKLEFDVTENDSANFIAELVGEQVLHTNLDISAIGNYNINWLLGELKSSNSFNYIKKIKNFLIELNDTNYLEKVKCVQDTLKDEDISVEAKNLLKATSFYKNLQFSFDSKIKKNLEECVSLLHKLNISSKSGVTFLLQFEKEFEEKYGEESIPLSVALDVTKGLSYPKSSKQYNEKIFSDIILPQHQLKFITKEFSPFHQILLKKLTNCFQSNDSIMHLDLDRIVNDIDLNNELLNIDNQLPLSYSCFGSIVDDKTIALKYAGGNASYLISRFAQDNVEIDSLLKKIVEKENQIIGNTAIIAEINYLPNPNIGNIVQRPSYREYEIPILSSSNTNNSVICINDLHLKMTNNGLLLFSKSLNKPVLPSLMCSHNYSQDNLPYYKFLCDYQYRYSESNLRFSWGPLTDMFSYFPRVIYDHIILSLETWYFEIDDFSDFTSINSIKTWLKKNKVPRLFKLKEYDNYLVIDQDSDESISLFISEIKQQQRVHLEEFVEFAQIKGIQNKANEIISFHFNTNYKLPYNNLESKVLIEDEHLNFHPGSVWIYYKLYIDSDFSDNLLSDFIFPFCNNNNNNFELFFFVRYTDKLGEHIRIRLKIHQDDYEIFNNKIVAFLNSLLTIKVIKSYRPDIYCREIRRYGINSIADCERWFAHDSICTLTVLSNLAKDKRWEFAICSINQLLEDFELTLNQRYELLTVLSESFRKEFGLNTFLRRQLSDKYRSLKLQIEHLNSTLPEIIRFHLNDRTNNTKKLIITIKKTNSNYLLELLPSMIHMLMNRIFPSNQRQHELYIYDLLHRHYVSAKARNNN